MPTASPFLADLDGIRYAGRALKTRRNRALWKRDPVAWTHDRLGEHLWSKQQEILHACTEEERVAVPSCHGAGKSRLASRAGLWFVDTADDPEDRFLVTTAPSNQQVRAILWRYMRQAHRKHSLVGEILQTAEWKVDGNLVGYGRKPADHDATGFQGIHAPDGVFTVVDEAGGVPYQLFVAVDALGTDSDSRQLLIGNPDDAASHFATICQREPGWKVIRISAFDTPNLTGEPCPPEVAKALVQRKWVEDKRTRWGESNPLYRAKVLGEFADSEDGLIPLSWIRAANRRWHDWQERREASPTRIEPPGARRFGVDVARGGEDKTAISERQGSIVNPDGQSKIETHEGLDTVQVSAIVARKLAAHVQSSAAIDVIGVGAGVFDQLSRAGKSVTAFNASKGTKRRDATGEWKFPNVRSAAWWNMRELLDPAMGATLALPEDDELTADLTTPKWDIRTGGVIVVEPKDETKKRLGRSPDQGDAVVINCWDDRPARADDEPADQVPDVVAHADSYERTAHDARRLRRLQQGETALLYDPEVDDEEPEILRFD